MPQGAGAALGEAADYLPRLGSGVELHGIGVNLKQIAPVLNSGVLGTGRDAATCLVSVKRFLL